MEVANISILDKIRAGLKLEAQEAPRKLENQIKAAYIVNDERIPISVHPHEKLGVYRRITGAGDGVATTITLTPPAGKCWLVDYICFDTGAAAPVLTDLSIDSEELAPSAAWTITTGVNSTITVWGNPYATNIDFRTLQIPAKYHAFCKLNIIITATAGIAATASLIAYVHERSIDVPDVQPRSVVT